MVILCIIIFGNVELNDPEKESNKTGTQNIINTETGRFDLSTIPEYTESPYIEINNNVPEFKEEEFTSIPFEKYSQWDALGRSGVAFANICKDTMPKEGEDRGEISSVKDLSGWKQKRYDTLIKDKYLYNRCHLIGWQLSAENANKQNLITGTRYFNTEGMLPFENKVADYIDKHQNNHVLYRVTPIYIGNNLLASGVQMEACSVEDKGQGIQFNVYCYNVQPGVVIDYSTGDSFAK
ncbi:MAG: DNA/RNA non-specific endonuclease [Clostridia bacterium]|nr:DNA/RNA non-specific endonuclease [Clostridia bacterium]